MLSASRRKPHLLHVSAVDGQPKLYTLAYTNTNPNTNPNPNPNPNVHKT